jgi:hypothetical protein
MLTVKVFSCWILVATVLVSGLLLTGSVNASTNITGIIDSDTTWAFQGSPYTLTGPTAVNQGVTLTIEPGVTVNLGDYYIQVNGTLVAEGTSSNPINLNGGQLVFTSVSKGWNEQTGKGNVIENAKINSISSSNSIKIIDSQLMGDLYVGNSSVISNNKITRSSSTSVLTVGDESKVDGNTITGTILAGDYVSISDNTVNSADNGKTVLNAGRACTISGNTVTAPTNIANAINAGYSSVIQNNIITGALTGSPSEISSNVVKGGGTRPVLFSFETYPVYAIEISSESCKFDSNTIIGTTMSAVHAYQATFTSNIIYGDIAVSNTSTFKSNVITGDIGGGNLFQNNKIEGIVSPQGSAVISGNSINGEIYCNDFSCEISDNTITHGGIYAAAGNIHNNLITDGSGISTGSFPATITANTLSKNSVGIYVVSVPPVISNNNIIDNTQNSIVLTGSGDVNASNNWWGTTDTQIIENSIRDFKNDFNLGKVNVLPILTASNQQAVPDPNINLPNSPFPSIPVPTLTPQATSTGGATVAGLLSWFGVFFILLLVVALVVVIIVVMVVKRTGRRNLPPPPPPA